MNLRARFTWICFAAALMFGTAPIASSQGRMVEVNGHFIYVFTAGWQYVGEGQPTVVIESGSTLPIQVWEDVLSRVAEYAPVVAFDPPGVGRSEWDGVSPTVDNMNQRLHRLLESVEAPAPYILVGHSWAGWLVRGFAGRYPDEVAGLVLVDPTPSQAEFLAAFEEIGVGEAGMDEFNQMMRAMSASWPPPMQAQQAVIAHYGERRTDPDVPPTPSVPVAVLVAGRFGDASVPDSIRPSFDLARFFDVLRRNKVMPQVEWVRASPDGTLILANNSQHCIQCDDPELVAWAIRHVLSSIRDEP